MELKEVIEELKFMQDDFECREKNEKHSGDCTKEAHTCMKCLWGDYLQATKSALTILERMDKIEGLLPKVSEIYPEEPIDDYEEGMCKGAITYREEAKLHLVKNLERVLEKVFRELIPICIWNRGLHPKKECGYIDLSYLAQAIIKSINE